MFARYARTPIMVALALLAVGMGGSALADEGVEVVPTLTIEGVDRVERAGTWAYAAPSRADLEREVHEEPRQVIFLMDVSRSMPRVHGRTGSFEAVVTDVVRRASAMLEPFRGRGALEISLYRFGDLASTDAGWQPAVYPFEGTIDIDVTDAIAALDTFVSDDPAVYDHDWTYVAASVFEAARRELGARLDEPVASDGDTPVFFVFTDAGDADLGGGESHSRRRDFDNTPYAAWLEREVSAARLEYHYWNLATDDLGTIAPPARETFRASWQDAGRLDVLNRGVSDGEAIQRTRRLPASEAILLSPQLAITDAEAVNCVARLDDDVVGIPLRDLRLTRTSEPTFTLGAMASYPVGEHRVSFDTEALCDELRRVYPNTDFMLPAGAALGFVEVVDEREFVVRFDGIEAPADAAWPAVEVDRLHRTSGSSRRYAMAVPDVDGLEVQTQWTARASLDGEWSDGLVTLRTADGVEGGVIVVEGDTPVTVDVARWDGPFWAATPIVHGLWGGPPVSVPGGDWVIEVCHESTVTALPTAGDRVRFDGCPSCARAPVVTEGRTCTTSTVTVEDRPMHVLWIVILVLVAGWTLKQIVHVIRWMPLFGLPVWLIDENDRAQPVIRDELIERIWFALTHKRNAGAAWFFQLGQLGGCSPMGPETRTTGGRGGLWARLAGARQARAWTEDTRRQNESDGHTVVAFEPRRGGARLVVKCGRLRIDDGPGTFARELQLNELVPIREGMQLMVIRGDKKAPTGPALRIARGRPDSGGRKPPGTHQRYGIGDVR